VQTAADEVSSKEPAKAIDLEHQSADKLKALGVKIVPNVDKSGFQKLADPYLDKLAAELGPYAVKIKDLIKAVR
jgi:TRAP-type C4-dicarboxylate transport system substrate-binding protein